MSWIIAFIIVLTVIQFITCHFSLWIIIALICRLLFICRIIGATFKVKSLATGELAAFACMFLFNILFSSDGIKWGKIALFALLSGLCVLLYCLDDILYIYIISDEED